MQPKPVVQLMLPVQSVVMPHQVMQLALTVNGTNYSGTVLAGNHLQCMQLRVVTWRLTPRLM